MAKPKIYQVDQLQTMVGSMNTAITAAHNQANSAYGAANTGGGPKIASIIYPGNDTAANNIGGQTIYLTGSGFYSNSSIYINGNSVPATLFISASNIGFTTPNLTNGIYPIYLVNYDGATAIKVPGIVISGEPSWNTAAGSLSSSQAADGAWSYSLSANGDAPIIYALAAGSSLPTGVSLNANGVISGTISSPPGSDTTYTFSVVASDAQNQDATRQFSVTATVGEGRGFANNVLLLHADGTNNGNNHQFLDSSNNNFTITRNGNATQGTFSPFSQTGWSAYFDGSTDSLTATNNAAYDFGSGAFTIEAWLNPSTGSQLAFASRGQTTGYEGWILSTTNFLATTNGSSWDITINFTTPLTAGAWNHVAIVRNGNVYTAYLNGVSNGTTTVSGTIVSGTAELVIGRRQGQTDYSGYISNFRIVKGTAVYTSGFTPPTSALTAISNTSLLTLQSNRFIDNSTNAFTITKNGDVSIQAFSPFAPTAAYSTANVGGSVYLDGSGDYLTPADSTATDLGISRQPFTLEWWTYFTTTSGGQYIISKGGGFAGWNSTTGWQYVFSIEFSSSVFSLGYWNGSSYTYWQPSFSSINVFGRWNHMVLSYDGTNLSAYINGTRIGTTTVTNFTKPSSSNKCGIGSTFGITGEAYYYNGYISGFRIVQGNALYDPTVATLTVPTSPPTNVSNTSLLLNFTNAQIFDQTGKNVLETIGDAKVSIAQYKYGTASMYFDGTGDYLVGLYNPMYDLGAADFTIEFWMYPTAVGQSSVTYIFYIGSSGNYAPILIGQAASGYGIVLYSSSSGSAWNLASGSSFGTATANAWNHVALVRNGSNVYLCLNGTITTTLNWGTTALLSSSSNRPNIGSATGVSNTFYTGYIDDLRITKGYARYTSNFTPPTSAFPNK